MRSTKASAAVERLKTRSGNSLYSMSSRADGLFALRLASPSGESEIVGFHVEYSGMGFAVFSLAEYSAMILCSVMASLLFLGGWLSPVGFLPDSILWLFAKTFAVLFFFLWIRATFPRYRYDQVMRLGWKVFIPVCLIWLLVVGCWMMSPWNIWK